MSGQWASTSTNQRITSKYQKIGWFKVFQAQKKKGMHIVWPTLVQVNSGNQVLECSDQTNDPTLRFGMAQRTDLQSKPYNA